MSSYLPCFSSLFACLTFIIKWRRKASDQASPKNCFMTYLKESGGLMVEHQTMNQEVLGFNPAGGLGHVLEQDTLTPY